MHGNLVSGIAFTVPVAADAQPLNLSRSAIAKFVEGGLPPVPPPPGTGSQQPEFEGVRVIIAIWPDGTIVWSSSLEKGGKPYTCGDIPVEDLRALFRRLTERDYLTNTRQTSSTLVLTLPLPRFSYAPDTEHCDCLRGMRCSNEIQTSLPSHQGCERLRLVSVAMKC